MKLSKAILILCALLFSQVLDAQIEFELAPSDLYNGELASQRDFVLDMNGDYLDDIVIIINSGLVIYYQQPNGEFTVKEFPLEGTISANWNALGGDFNGDGLNDVVVGNENNISFIMSDIPSDGYIKFIMPEDYFVQRTTGIDIDLDGDLDAFSCNDVGINKIFENMNNAAMVSNPALLPTIDLAGNYSNTWCDYDNDGDPDLLISKCYLGANVDEPERINLFYQNNGDGSYSEIGESINMNDKAQSWVTNMEDFDNDGDFDAYVANHDIANRLMINNGNGTFTDTINSTGIQIDDFGAFESFAYDFDNNGYIDILTDSKKRIWLNNGDLTFTPVLTPMFMWFNGAVGDLNNDGFYDFMVGVNAWFNKPNDNNWIKINTQGIESNINGVGARVEIYGEWGKQIREVRAGKSFSTMSTLTTHFGIGEASSIDSLVIKWPSGIKSTKINPAINTTHLIQEYECILENISISEETEITICEGNSHYLVIPDLYDSVIWSDGTIGPEIYIASSGVFYANIIDQSGCYIQSDPVHVELISETPPTIFPSGIIEICQGDTITLTATTDQEEYNWSIGANTQGIQVADAGSYFVETTSVCSGQSFSSEPVIVEVVVAPLPIVTDITINSGESITLVAEGQNILWFSAQEGGNVIAVGPEFTTPFLTMDATFYVGNAITSASGNLCQSERVPVNVFITSLEEQFIELGINAYPNPAQSFIHIDIESFDEIYSISLINSLGQVVHTIDNVQEQNNFDLNGIPSGNYKLTFVTESGTIAKSIVVSK